MFDFMDRVVMVTGAAGNLGQAVAECFMAAGASLVLVDRAADRLARLYPDLVDSSRAILGHSVDLTDPIAVEHLVGLVIERFGRVDVLANIAGGYRAGTAVHETPLETWDYLYALNLRTALVAARAVIPQMLNQGGGHIVNVAARAALKGGRNMAAYSVSKGAIVRLTESLSAELKRASIHVNCVLPGTIDTPANRNAMPAADTSRWVEPEALAEVILFLSSEASRAIHGAAIPAYGIG